MILETSVNDYKSLPLQTTSDLQFSSRNLSEQILHTH